jgi:6-phosphogluconolactonase (cycloisomerase 2 family)
MKFSKLSQLFLVSSIGLLVATLLTACDIETVDYVFVANSSGIETYAVDSQSGALRTGAATVTTDVNSPVAMAVTSDYQNLYVANGGNNTIVHFTISSNGVLTADSHTVTLGATPVSLAVNTAGTYLYVVSGTSSATLTEYSLTSGAIGGVAAQVTLSLPLSSGHSGDTLIPTSITVLSNTSAVPGNGVFVTAYDQSAYNPSGTVTCPIIGCANPGWVFGFSVGTGGALIASLNSPYEAGVKPSAIAADPDNIYLYVTDYASSELIGYTILDNNTPNINISLMNGDPFPTGRQPSALTLDPRGIFIYVTNENDNSVSAYAITLANGYPTVVANITGSPINQTDPEPVAVAIDPALGRYLYTANNLGNSISGFNLNPTSGSPTPTQSSPYLTGLKPTALVIIPHGNHTTQSITP